MLSWEEKACSISIDQCFQLGFNTVRIHILLEQALLLAANLALVSLECLKS
jgi:hypothetical protein